MTVRRSSYRSLRSLQRDTAVCRACVEAGFPLESWPVRAPLANQRADLNGQAPGPTLRERWPLTDDAQRTLDE